MRLSAKTKTGSFCQIGVRFPTAIIAATAVLYGCGGGGSASDGSATTVPEEKPVTLPITEMPTSSYSGFKQEAFERLNEARIAAGVSAVKQNAQLDAAAQAHAGYLAGNYVTGHYEDVNKPLFTGYSHADRAKAQGYANSVRSEVIAYFYGVSNGAQHVNLHLNSVYHLAGAMDAAANEVGLGFSGTSTLSPYTPSSFTFGTTDTRLRSIDAMWVWPTDGSKDVPTHFYPERENPNPLPDIAGDDTIAVGPPTMFCTNADGITPLEILDFGLSENRTARPARVRLLHHNRIKATSQAGSETKVDPNLATFSMSNCVFLVPLEPLSASATYEVQIKAVKGSQDMSKKWTFSTAVE